MNAIKQGTWLFLTLIILAGSGWYYGHNSTLFRLDREALANSVDTTVYKLNVRQFDAKGTLVNSLKTPVMQHIQNGNIYLFQKPHILVTHENQSPWDIRSNKAKSIEGGKSITFSGNVVVYQDHDKSTMKTEEVTYYPKEKKATTELLVTYEQPGNVIQSKGMNAYIDEKRIELLHQARGSYVPAKG